MLQQQRTFVLLYSKTFLLKYGIEINANEDLNNLIEPGTYYSKSSTITTSLTNCPLSSLGFIMTVNYTTGNDPLYICQTIYGRSDGFTPIIYVRHKANSSWGEWYSFSDDATLPLPLMNTMKKIHTGWIRVAKYQAESVTVAQGSKGYGALLTIKSFYSNRYPVYYIISFHAGHQISGFTILDSYKGNGILQNIRHTVDANTNTAYIELNISDAASESNSITVTILDNINGYGDQKWESVNAESTDESVSGVTVVSSLSLQ